VFVNHRCEVKGEQDGEADKPEESFCELVIASGDPPIALDPFEEVVRLLRAGMHVFIPFVAAVCLRLELS
jgi:hypothetical protein